MVTHFNMVLEQAEVLGFNLTATHYQKNLHMLGHERESGPHMRGVLRIQLSNKSVLSLPAKAIK